MADCEKILYKGQEIFYFNHEGLRGKALLENLKLANNMILETDRNDVLTLANFTNTYADEEVVKYVTGQESQEASKRAKKTAVVGVTGIKRIFLNMYNAISRTEAKTFDDLEAAKEYLVS